MPFFNVPQTIDITTFLIHGCAFYMLFLLILKGFVENVDYTSSHKIVKRDKKGYGNKTTSEYMLTVDTAKNIYPNGQFYPMGL